MSEQRGFGLPWVEAMAFASRSSPMPPAPCPRPSATPHPSPRSATRVGSPRRCRRGDPALRAKACRCGRERVAAFGRRGSSSGHQVSAPGPARSVRVTTCPALRPPDRRGPRRLRHRHPPGRSGGDSRCSPASTTDPSRGEQPAPDPPATRGACRAVPHRGAAAAGFERLSDRVLSTADPIPHS